MPKKEHYLKFTVKDNGPGIPSPYHKKVFQPFQKLKHKAEYEGNGIGFSLVKKLVEIHGGGVSLTSTLNVGTILSLLGLIIWNNKLRE